MATDIHATRLENMRTLMQRWGGPTSLSRKLDHANGSQLAQCAGPNPTRVIGEKFARAVEDKLGLPGGWLDQVHAAPSDMPSIDDELLVRVSLAVTEAAGTRRLTPQQHARLVALVYDHSVSGGAVDDAYVKKLVSLLG